MVIKSEKYYKILHVPSGLFKANGYNGEFNRAGKIWKGQHLKAHLRQFQTTNGIRRGEHLVDEINREYTKYRRANNTTFPVDECIVIEYEMISQKQTPLRDFIENKMENKNG